MKMLRWLLVTMSALLGACATDPKTCSDHVHIVQHGGDQFCHQGQNLHILESGRNTDGTAYVIIACICAGHPVPTEWNRAPNKEK